MSGGLTQGGTGQAGSNLLSQHSRIMKANQSEKTSSKLSRSVYFQRNQ